MSKRPARSRAVPLLVVPVIAALTLSSTGVASAATGAHRWTRVDGGATTTTIGATTTTIGSSLVVTRDWPPPATGDNVPPEIPSNVSVGDAQNWIHGAISDRVSQVAALQYDIDSGKNVASSTQAAIDAIAQADTTGLTNLQNAAGNAGDLPTLQSIADQMVLDYRVFSVLTPQCNEVMAAENQLAAEHRLSGLETALEAAIAAESGKVASQLSARIGDYTSQLSSVESTSTAALTTLLGLSPKDYSGALGALSTTRAGLDGSDQALAAARADLRAILSVLAKPGAISGSARVAIFVKASRLFGKGVRPGR